jgi:hypothetical protein
MELGLVTETWGADDQTWLGSRHGTGNARSITLSFTGNVPFVKSNYEEADTYKGFIPSGTAIAIRTDGRAVPYVHAGATEGNGVLAGFLLTPVKVPVGNDAVGALLDHGRVRFSRLPSGQTLGTKAQLNTAAAGHFVVED